MMKMKIHLIHGFGSTIGMYVPIFFLKIPSAIIFIILLEGVFNVSTGTG